MAPRTHPGYTSIVYRRYTIEFSVEGWVAVSELLDRSVAQQYASWFRALADPSRVQIVEYLARAGRPMSVGEIVTAAGLAQSTVSQHLRILAGVRFVLVDQVRTARHYRINDACVDCFPSAADLVMGKPAPRPIGEC